MVGLLGDATPTPAAADLVRTLHTELHRVAQGLFRGQDAGITLQPTALVNEAYLKLAGHDAARFRDREHFLAVAALAMRQVLVDHARRRLRLKRGGDRDRVSLDAAAPSVSDSAVDLVDLDSALRALAELDARKAEVVTMRHFGGLTNAEIARVLGVGTSTVNDDWTFSKAWLQRRLRATNDTA